MAIITRIGKGSELTTVELDNNFSELNTRTVEAWANTEGVITIPPSNGPSIASYNGIQVISFDDSVTQEVSVAFHIPKDYVPGTAIIPHGHLVAPTNTVGDVRWGFSFTYANEWSVGGGTPAADQTFQAIQTVYVVDSFDASQKDVHKVTMAGQMTVPNMRSDGVMLMKVWRDGLNVLDTYTASAYLLHIDLYYRSQGFGSTTY